MDEIVTDPNDTKSLPLQMSGSLNDLQVLLASAPFVSTGLNTMHFPDPFVVRISAIIALVKEINHTLPPQTPPVVSRNETTASPLGSRQATKDNEAIASPHPQGLRFTAGSSNPEITQVTAAREAAASPLLQIPPVAHPNPEITQITAAREAAASPFPQIPPADHPWLAKAGDPWYVRHQKELIAAQPEDQREKVYNAMVEQGQQGERAYAAREAAASPAESRRGPDTGSTSIVCTDCGMSFTPNGYIQRRVDDGTYQAPKRDPKCRAERRRLFSGAVTSPSARHFTTQHNTQNRLTPNSPGGVGTYRVRLTPNSSGGVGTDSGRSSPTGWPVEPDRLACWGYQCLSRRGTRIPRGGRSRASECCGGLGGSRPNGCRTGRRYGTVVHRRVHSSNTGDY